MKPSNRFSEKLRQRFANEDADKINSATAREQSQKNAEAERLKQAESFAQKKAAEKATKDAENIRQRKENISHELIVQKFDRQKMINDKEMIKAKLLDPPIFIRSATDHAVEECEELLNACEEKEKFIDKNISNDLVYFSKPWLTTFCLLVSAAIAIFAVLNEYGLDIAGGSELLTIACILVAVLAIDFCIIILLKGLLISLRSFCTPARYSKIMASCIVVSGGTGVLAFAVMIFTRMKEAGV